MLAADTSRERSNEMKDGRVWSRSSALKSSNDISHREMECVKSLKLVQANHGATRSREDRGSTTAPDEEVWD